MWTSIGICKIELFTWKNALCVLPKACAVTVWGLRQAVHILKLHQRAIQALSPVLDACDGLQDRRLLQGIVLTDHFGILACPFGGSQKLGAARWLTCLPACAWCSARGQHTAA